ncbi:MAG: hypothetical protein KA236_02940 [Verrucomicrobia bacterium]|nr:hypothetical protein [Verrucomicrobiota bacterium]
MPIKKKLAQPNSAPSTNGSSATNSKSSPEEKVKLFRSLFRGRDEVYAVRWEVRNNGKTGYSPACRRIWGVPYSEQPKEFFPLTNQVIHDHLTGTLTAGVFRREFRASSPTGEGALHHRPDGNAAAQRRPSPNHYHAVRADSSSRECKGTGSRASFQTRCHFATDQLSVTAFHRET